jgi:hypothetical protein
MQARSETSLSRLIFILRRRVWTHVIVNKYSSSLQAEAFEVALVLLPEIFVYFINFFPSYSAVLSYCEPHGTKIFYNRLRLAAMKT